MSCYQPALGPEQYLPRRYSSHLFGEALKESQSVLNSSCLHMVPVFTAMVTLSTTPPPCTPPSRPARGSQENSFLRGGQRAAAEWCMGVAVARAETRHSTLYILGYWLDTAGVYCDTCCILDTGYIACATTHRKHQPTNIPPIMEECQHQH